MVARAIKSLVVLLQDLRHRPREIDPFQNFVPCLRMRLNYRIFEIGQLTGLVQDFGRDAAAARRVSANLQAAGAGMGVDCRTTIASPSRP